MNETSSGDARRPLCLELHEQGGRGRQASARGSGALQATVRSLDFVLGAAGSHWGVFRMGGDVPDSSFTTMTGRCVNGWKQRNHKGLFQQSGREITTARTRAVAVGMVWDGIQELSHVL